MNSVLHYTYITRARARALHVYARMCYITLCYITCACVFQGRLVADGSNLRPLGPGLGLVWAAFCAGLFCTEAGLAGVGG